MKRIVYALFLAAALAMAFTPLCAGELININTATVEQLETLDGIGPKLARAIIQYRKDHGPFKTIDELKNVPGIGEKKLAAMRSQLAASSPKKAADPK